MTDEEQGQNRWYHSVFGQGLGIGSILAGLGLAAMLTFKGCSNITSSEDTRRVEESRIEAQVEVQRLKTVEEVVRQYGAKKSPEELKKIIDDYKLGK